MHEAKFNGIPIALALFFAIVLISFSMHVNPQNIAHAISASDFTLNTINNEVFYQASIDTYVILQKSTGTDSTKLCFLEGRSDTPTTDQVCYTIFPQKDNCDTNPADPINYNPCSATTGTTDCDTDFQDSLPCSNKTGLTGDWEGLWCGSTYCYILFDYSTGSWSSQLIRIWSVGVSSSQTGDISGYRNITNTWLLQPAIWGYDECNPAPPQCGLGGITLFWAYTTALASTVQLVREGGTSLMGTSSSVDTVMCIDIACNGVAASEIANIDGCRHCGGTQGLTRIIVSAPNSSAVTQRTATIWSEGLALISAHNDDNITTNCAGTVTGQSTNTGYSAYLGGNVNRFIFNSDSGLITISTAGSIGASNCYPNAGLPWLVSRIKSIDFDADNGIWYVWHGSTQPLASVTAMNLSATTTIFDDTVDFAPNDITIGDTISGWVDGGQLFNSMAVAYDVNTILLTTDSSKARLLYLDGFALPPTAGQQVCIDTLVGNQINLICYTDIDKDGIADVNSPAGLLLVNRAQTNITATAGIFGCGIGLSSCTDLNSKTNGMGLLLMLILLTFFFSMILLACKKLDYPINHVSPVFWIVLVLGVTGVAYQANWTDAIPFTSAIVAVAGFTGLKLSGRL